MLNNNSDQDNPSKNKILEKYNGNALLDCLVIFLKMNGRPFSKESLIAGLPIEIDKNTPILFSKNSSKSLFSRAASKAGFKTKIYKTELEDLSRLLLPAIILLKNGNNDDLKSAILLGFDDEMENARIIMPEISDVENNVPIKELKKEYYGMTILLKKELLIDEPTRNINSITENHWLWGSFKIVKNIYRDVLIASLLINIFVLSTPFFTMNVYDRVVPNGATQTLWVLSLAIIFIYIIDLILKFIRSYFLEIAGKKTDIIASSIIFERVMDLRLSSLPNSIGSLANIMKEFESIRGFLTSTTMSLIIDLPFIIIFLGAIVYISGAMVIIPIITIILILLYSFFAKQRLTKSINEAYDAGSNKNGVLIESLSSIETLKALGALGYAQWKWEEATSQIADKSINSKMISSSITTISSFLVQLNTVAIIIVGTYMIIDMNLTMGGLIATVIISSRAIAPMGQLASLIATYEHTKTSFKALNDIMELPVEHPKGKKFIARPEYKGKIELRDVNFSYPDNDKLSLHNLNIKINPKEKVAIIGKIGSGKSTVQKLLTALYFAQEGAILIDDIDIRQLDPNELRKNIAYVEQDSILMNGTIRDNIIYRAPHSDDEKVIEVARISGVMDFLNKHPKGFDMAVGERGNLLSGGQKQAVSIARALLLNSPIVIFDEPTNSMDHISETKFITRIKEHIKEKTFILVTHKMSLLKLVDRVIVMDEGKVILDGKKDYVINKLNNR